LSRYLEELRERKLSLLIYRGGEVVFSSAGEGIKPLLDAIEVVGRDGLRGAIIADKIVGRAAALLAAYVEAVEVHAALISAGAIEVLNDHGMSFYFDEETVAIRSRDGKDICPFERLVQGISDPEEAYGRIRAKALGL